MYSTCTLAPEENEAVVHMLLSLYPELELQNIEIDYKNIKK
jgi:16S rRNA C967 or C1407 C5-methylase (RsmB/RsmF family)